ncbi:MAG TPA: hypothetical protein VMU42_02665 [Candidatus Sulfotelmatobacter sp.]|nr:hypothetical protein [Candidatus Sulfotelmatobacter sp.]
MSVLRRDLIYYGSAAMPEADGATVGGAVDFTRRVSFADIAPAGTLDYVAAAAVDTATRLTSQGRDASGVVRSETVTLGGTTVVAGTQSYERLLALAASGATANGPLANPGGTAASGDVAAIGHTRIIAGHTAQGAANATAGADASITLQAGDGASVAPEMIIRITNNSPAGVQYQLRRILAVAGDVCTVNRDWSTLPGSATTYDVAEGMLCEIAPNPVSAVIRVGATIAADVAGGAGRSYYEKIFTVNNNTTTALTAAAIALQAESPALPGSAALAIALCNALDDSGSVANRQTAPASGITAFTSGAPPQSIGVPAPGNLPAGAAPNAAGAQGIWINWNLSAGTAAYKGTATLRTQGTTT